MTDVDEREARNPFSGPRADLGRRAQTTDTIIIGVAVIAGLYFGREVLVPMSIAVLLSFVLVPVADALSRLRIGRIASVLIAVALAFAILGILGAIIGRQAAQLSENLARITGRYWQETGRRKEFGLRRSHGREGR